jgi:hypothetical protein
MASPPLPPAIRLLHFVLAVACACGPAPALSGQSPSPPTTPSRVPVLVELFTSEGCSDCPPADNLLGQLDAKQPIPGAEAIVLSEHVTYWNHDGWHDPFSLDAMTERQEDYDRLFGLTSAYTPQMVIDGTTQLVGNNPQALSAAIAKAARVSKEPLSIENATWDHGSVTFSVRGQAPSHTKLFAALAANATRQEVSAGENSGRTLHHVAVVRTIKEFGRDSTDGRPLKLSGADFSRKDESDGPVRLVVFLADSRNDHVLGMAEKLLEH